MTSSPPEAIPAEGQVVTVHVDGRAVAVWWGRDGEHDRVAVRDGRMLTWSTAEACAEAAALAGWLDDRDEDEDDVTPSIATEPVQDWLAGRVTALDPDAALNLWNFAGDVAASTGSTWRDRDWAADRCHTKLTAACVPWLFDRERYEPRWTPIERRRLREVLSAAVHVLRTALPPAPRTT
jgi:hypothetical protein